MYMAELRNTFIRNLKFYRKQKGFRQLDLALELGRNPNYINSIENGKYFPSPETIEEIAHFLEIEPIRLFDSEISPASSAPAAALPDLKAIESQIQEIISNDIRKVFSEIGEDEG